MGTSKFQSEYIEYLQECNSNLHDKLMKMKEFESRILNKELRNRHSDMVLKEITNICDSTCEAIDNLFEHFTATMNSLQNVLMWKSQVSQIPKKLSFAMKSGSHSYSHMPLASESVNDTNHPVNEIPEIRTSKKCETAKVSPMIKGHVISTPRIHLNRVSQDVGLQSNRTFGTVLSPIMEASPITSPRVSRVLSGAGLREVRIPLRRLQLSNYTGRNSRIEGSDRENASPRLNVMKNKPGFNFRQRCCSLEARDQFQVKPVFPEPERESRNSYLESVAENSGNEEAQNTEAMDKSDERTQNSPEEMDPIEGPSWLLDKERRSQPDQSPNLSDFHYNSINFKRPNHSSFNRSANDEEKKKEILNINDNAQMGNFECFGNGEESREAKSNLEKESDEKYLSDEGETESSPFEESSRDSREEASTPVEAEHRLTRESEDEVLKSRGSFRDVFGNRVSKISSETSEILPVLRGRKSTQTENQSHKEFSCENNNVAAPASPNCSVLLYRISVNNLEEPEYVSPLKSKTVSPKRQTSIRKSSRFHKKNLNSEARNSNSDDLTQLQSRTLFKSKRRAAELCSQRINLINVKAQESSPYSRIKCRLTKKNRKKQKKTKKC